MLDCVELEMRMAQLMTQQEASGFRFDVSAAERVRTKGDPTGLLRVLGG